jgi:hypothetical protein
LRGTTGASNPFPRVLNGVQAKAAAKKPTNAASKPSSATSKPKTPPNNQNEATHETKQHTSSKKFTVFRKTPAGSPIENTIEINKANSVAIARSAGFFKSTSTKTLIFQVINVAPLFDH